MFPDNQTLHSASLENLEDLAKDLRSTIERQVLAHGGHLASNLGVIELSIALHASFDIKKDKLVWDTGHQAYAHKLLTGRACKFPSLRSKNGLSGYPLRMESQFDAFGTGHAGTSISAALGIRTAMDACGKDGFVVAIIGDGAFGCGMVYEALNHCGAMNRSHFIIVLNDNGMSINETIGGVHDNVWKRAANLRHFANTLGLNFIGDIDGHNIHALMKNMQKAKKSKRPVLLHVISKKGMGHGDAEQNPSRWHSVVRPTKCTHLSFSDTLGLTLLELRRSDPRIIAITAAMKDGVGLTQFASEYPESFIDVGICEQHAVTFAAGLATEGMRPFCVIYSSFLQRAYDQIIHDVCLQELPVIFAIDRAGFVGEDGATHQGLFDIAFLRCIPNLSILVPKDGTELRLMLKHAVTMNTPVAIRYPRRQTQLVYESCEDQRFSIYDTEVPGNSADLLIIALGPMTSIALEIRSLAANYGIRVCVIPAKSAHPIVGLVSKIALEKYKIICTLEEHTISGGFGSAMLECLHENGVVFERPILRFGVQDPFMQHATQDEQFLMAELSAEKILERIMATLGRSSSQNTHRRVRSL